MRTTRVSHSIPTLSFLLRQSCRFFVEADARAARALAAKAAVFEVQVGSVVVDSRELGSCHVLLYEKHAAGVGYLIDTGSLF